MYNGTLLVTLFSENPLFSEHYQPRRKILAQYTEHILTILISLYKRNLSCAIVFNNIHMFVQEIQGDKA